MGEKTALVKNWLDADMVTVPPSKAIMILGGGSSWDLNVAAKAGRYLPEQMYFSGRNLKIFTSWLWEVAKRTEKAKAEAEAIS